MFQIHGKEHIPIPKSVSVKEIENDLRPISLTPILSKTMEHFVVEWIMSQIRHLVERKQFGSLAGLSTTHALLSFVHHQYKFADQANQGVRVLFLEFSKAFDRIDHYILFHINVGPIVLEIRLFRLLQYNIMNN